MERINQLSTIIVLILYLRDIDSPHWYPQY